MASSLRDLFVVFDGSVLEAVDAIGFERTGPTYGVHVEKRDIGPSGTDVPPDEHSERRKRSLASAIFKIPATTPLHYRLLYFDLTSRELPLSDWNYDVDIRVRIDEIERAAVNLDADPADLVRHILLDFSRDVRSGARAQLQRQVHREGKRLGLDISVVRMTRSADDPAWSGSSGEPHPLRDPDAAPDLADHLDRRRFRRFTSRRSRLAQMVRARGVEQGAAIWISGSAEQGEALRAALQELLDQHDADLTADGPARSGSWWQRFTVTIRKTAREQDLPGKLDEVEQGLRARYLDNQTAQNDNLKADAVGKVIAQLGEIEEAVIVLGQLVMVKHDKRLVVKSVDAMTAARIEKHQTLLSDPAAVITMLSTIGSEEAHPSLHAQQAHAALEQPPEPPRPGPY